MQASTNITLTHTAQIMRTTTSSKTSQQSFTIPKNGLTSSPMQVPNTLFKSRSITKDMPCLTSQPTLLNELVWLSFPTKTCYRCCSMLRMSTSRTFTRLHTSQYPSGSILTIKSTASVIPRALHGLAATLLIPTPTRHFHTLAMCL
jgi:hypothetical protein